MAVFASSNVDYMLKAICLAVDELGLPTRL
jgi:hypothetical protein